MAHSKLEHWKQLMEMQLKMVAETMTNEIELLFSLKMGPEEVSRYVDAVQKRQVAIMRVYVFKILDEIFAKQVKAATGNAPGAAADKKAGADNDEASTTPEDDNDKTVVNQADNKANTSDQSSSTSGPALATMLADTQKPATVPAATTPVTQKSEVVVTDVKSKVAQRKKKSGLASGALAKAWLAGDD